MIFLPLIENYNKNKDNRIKRDENKGKICDKLKNFTCDNYFIDLIKVNNNNNNNNNNNIEAILKKKLLKNGISIGVNYNFDNKNLENFTFYLTKLLRETTHKNIFYNINNGIITIFI